MTRDAQPPPIHPLVHMDDGPGGLPRVRVSNAHGEAVVFLHGAHAAAWRPAGQRPVLWMSASSAFAAGKPIRGGIPICFPWFGPNAAHPTAPAHGFARLQPWTFIEARPEADGGTTVELGLATAADPSRPDWPHASELRYSVSAGPTLGLVLEVRNTGADRFTFEAALHTYFAVSDVRTVTITGLEGTEYLDKVANLERRRQPDQPVHITGETDRVYLATRATCTIHDPGWARRLVVSKEGSDSTVVWNPWTAKARAMPDFGDDEWPQMVCIETCNVGPHAVSLAPGASHAMRATLAVVPG